MAKGSRSITHTGPKGSMNLPMELPQGLNPELLAQVLGGGIGNAEGIPAGFEGEKEEDDGVDRSRWQIIYPAYLNKKYTAARGRRVSQAIAVEDPTVQEMKMICEHFSVPAHIEITKRYPRDWLLSAGRLRVKLLKEDGAPYSAEVPTKKKLMQQMCLLIPKLKTRSVQSPQQAAAGGGGKKKKKK
ncbi:hypothetical protein Efla_001143 [Eimeria flavescens]